MKDQVMGDSLCLTAQTGVVKLTTAYSMEFTLLAFPGNGHFYLNWSYFFGSTPVISWLKTLAVSPFHILKLIF